METILELEPSEIAYLQGQLKAGGDTWKQNAADIFEDCFMMLTTSSGAKPDSFKILKQIQIAGEEDSENQILLS